MHTRPLPSNDDPPIVWARFYRSLGWMPLPVRCAEDIEGYADFLYRKRRRDLDERGALTAEVDARLRVEADDEARATAKAPMVPWATRGDVSDTEVAAWWGGGRGHLRGIWVVMGRLRDGAPAGSVAPLAVDVDPRSGGVAEEWDPGTGPAAETPSGGRHFLHVAEAGIDCSVGAEGRGLAPGIDVRASGGGIVVPSGSSSPGRSWTRWEPLAPVTERVREAHARSKGKPATRPAARSQGQAGSEGGGGDGAGYSGSTRAASTVAEILAAPSPDGTRNAHAAAIVGILARPSAIPEDALAPALDILREHGEDDEALVEWARTLTRGPRTAEDAVAFLAAWNATRCDPPWGDGKCERTARSLWKTADRREGGNAGAEDLIAGDPWSPASVPPPPASLPPEEHAYREAAVATMGGASGLAVALAAAPATSAVVLPTVGEVIDIETRKRREMGAIPEGFALPLSRAYTIADIEADLDVEPISLAYGPKWLRWDEREDLDNAYGYGLGPWFDESVAGGLTRGSFWALGALTAKAGKTTFLGQLVEGLTISSALRLLNNEDGPIVLPFWITEMRKHRDVSHRMFGRYLDIDISMIGRGRRAHEAPGIKHVALSFGEDPKVVAAAAFKRIRNHLADDRGVLALARELTINIDPQKLPQKRGGRHAEDPRLGVALLRTVERAIVERVEAFAAEWRIDPARIFPLLILDPVHRFIDASGEDRLTAVNAVIHAAREMAHERGWIALCTSDTTKAGAASDKTMDGDPAALASAAFAGSQNLAHEPDTVIVLHAEQVERSDSSYIVKVPVQVRVCLCRRASPGPALPFIWTPHVGRYVPQDPTIKPTGRPQDLTGIPSAGTMAKRRGRPTKT